MSANGADLKSAAVSGGVWSFAGQIALFVIQFLSVAVLARLLEPEDFGLIGLMIAAVAVLGLFREIGLTTAIVQKTEVAEAELTRLLWLTAMLGVSLGLLASGVGVVAAKFVDEPRLVGIAPWFGVCFVLNSLEAVPLGLLRRALRFRELVVRDVIAKLVSTAICVYLAWSGWSYWALVAQSVIMAVLNLVLTWLTAGWRPIAVAAPWAAIAPYVKFGAAFTGSNLAAYFTQNLDSILIGKFSGLNALGLYSRARALMVTPLSQAMGPIGAVLIPIMSRLKDEPVRLSAWIDKLSRIFLFLSAPAAAVLMAGSSDLVEVFLGKKWMGAAPIFWWLAILVASTPLGSLLYWVLVCSGRGKLLFQWTLIGSVLTCVAIAAAVAWGPVAVAASVGLVALFGRSIVAIYFAGKTGFFEWRQMLRRFFVGVLHGMLWLGATTWVVVKISPYVAEPWARLMVLGFVSVVLLAIVTFLTPIGRSVWNECHALFRWIRQRRTT